MKSKGVCLTLLISLCAITGPGLGGCAKDQPASSGSAGQGASLRVMTFNLRTAAAKDKHPWEKRWAAAKEVINKEAPDIIGTQEGLLNQLTDLEGVLPKYKWIGLGRDKGDTGEYMAIFYNKERLKPLEQHHYWLSATPDVPGSKTWGNNYARMVTWVKFEDLTSHTKFYVVNTHLDHQFEAARQLGAELIVRSMEAFDPSLPVILTGDFNTNVGSNPYKAFTAAGEMKDAVLEAAERVNVSSGTFHNYAGGTGGDTIDWILYRGDVLAKRSEKVTFSLNGEYPSDHYPVVADVVLKERAAGKQQAGK